MLIRYLRCLDLQDQIRRCQRWQRVEDGVDGFLASVAIKKRDRTIEVAIYRKRVFHETRKNYQLDLFDPDNGTWAYCAVAPACVSTCDGCGASWGAAASCASCASRTTDSAAKQLTVTDFGDPPSVSSDIAPHSVPRTVAKAGGSMDRATRIA